VLVTKKKFPRRKACASNKKGHVSLTKACSRKGKHVPITINIWVTMLLN